MVFKSYRDESRTNWGVTVAEATKPDRDQLYLGCMLRIADATELMASNYIYIGRFATEEEAAIAYNKKMIELHGPNCRLNKIESNPLKQ